MKILLPFPILLGGFILTVIIMYLLIYSVSMWFVLMPAVYLCSTMEWWESFPWITISRRKE